MFVVDSADASRLEEAKRTLLEVVGHEQLKGVTWRQMGVSDAERWELIGLTNGQVDGLDVL